MGKHTKCKWYNHQWVGWSRRTENATAYGNRCARCKKLKIIRDGWYTT